MYKKMIDSRSTLVMVVDDSKYMRLTIVDFLKKIGYEVLEAENGKQALALYEDKKPDIILMDKLMPVMDGITACKELQKLPGGSLTPVIMITSQEDEDSVEQAFQAGATDYISKPIHWAVLRNRIKRLVNARYTEISLAESEAFAQSIINYALDGIITVDKDGKIRSFNPASEHIFGYNFDEIIGKNIKILIPEFLSKVYNEIHSVNHNGTNITGITREITGHRKDTTTFPLELTVSQFYSNEEPVFIIIFRDVSERYHYEETIRHQAFHDSLTNLPNRLLLKNRLNQEIFHAKFNKQRLVLMYIDLDRFKLVNDTQGHGFGDKLLQIITNRLRNCVRKNDTIARMSGDEFTILLTGIKDKANIVKIAQKILNTIRDPIEIADQKLYITGSIGIAVYPEDGGDVEALLKSADIAMYRAKEKGKNNFQFFTLSLNEKVLKRLEMENNLHKAIDNNELMVYYQPKINAETEKIIGMEALVRWQHPELGMIMPDKFIPLAEDTGLIVPIGEWVLRTACAQNKTWQDQGYPPLKIAVNLSGRQFELQNLSEIIINILKETGLDPKWLELEITERVAMQNAERTLEIMRELKDIGVQFVIDDFGTGYSSLSYLKKFSVSKLKIDKSFIQELNLKQDSTITTTIINLGKNLKLEVVGEGVENKIQYDFLKRNQCDELQGFLFGKPMPADEFRKLLDKISSD